MIIIVKFIYHHWINVNIVKSFYNIRSEVSLCDLFLMDEPFCISSLPSSAPLVYCLLGFFFNKPMSSEKT